jgi:hypothetical protein
LEHALTKLLGELGLTYVIDDEVLLITAKASKKVEPSQAAP